MSETSNGAHVAPTHFHTPVPTHISVFSALPFFSSVIQQTDCSAWEVVKLIPRGTSRSSSHPSCSRKQPCPSQAVQTAFLQTPGSPITCNSAPCLLLYLHLVLHRGLLQGSTQASPLGHDSPMRLIRFWALFLLL